MSDIFTGKVPTPFGDLVAEIEDDQLKRLGFNDIELSTTTPPPLFLKLIEELEEYFKGIRKTFDLPVKPEVTPFREDCLRAMSEIRYGETISYKELASNAGHPKAIRAAASACAKNPIAIIYPCHRVIRSDGTIGNYGGGKAMKKWLLQREGIVLK